MKPYMFFVDQIPQPELVTPVVKYYAYRSGQIFAYDTLSEAKIFSNLTEKVYVNDDEVRQYNQDHRVWCKAVNDLWYEALKEEYVYGDLTEYIFDKCYEKARYATEEYGYDAVAEELADLTEFVFDILKHR
jgi:predicted house-cleaning noncanonical NTP pyrophosphatase (MazG superfamily)